MGLMMGRDALQRALWGIEADLCCVEAADAPNLDSALGRVRALLDVVIASTELPAHPRGQTAVPNEFVDRMVDRLNRAESRPLMGKYGYLESLERMSDREREMFLTGKWPNRMAAGKWWPLSEAVFAPPRGEICIVWTAVNEVEIAVESEDGEWTTVPLGQKLNRPVYWLEILHPKTGSPVWLGNVRVEEDREAKA